MKVVLPTDEFAENGKAKLPFVINNHRVTVHLTIAVHLTKRIAANPAALPTNLNKRFVLSALMAGKVRCCSLHYFRVSFAVPAEKKKKNLRYHKAAAISILLSGVQEGIRRNSFYLRLD